MEKGKTEKHKGQVKEKGKIQSTLLQYMRASNDSSTSQNDTPSLDHDNTALQKDKPDSPSPSTSSSHGVPSVSPGSSSHLPSYPDISNLNSHELGTDMTKRQILTGEWGSSHKYNFPSR